MKLGVDTPIKILEEAKENGMSDDGDPTVMDAARFYFAQCQLLGYNGVHKDEKEAVEGFREQLDAMYIGGENRERWGCAAWDSAGRYQRIVSPPSVNVSFRDLMEKYIEGVRKNAEQGDAAAQFKLGMYHTLAMGVPHDPRESIKWIRQAADKGNADAQYTLATYYAEGYGGLPVSRTEFEKWVRLAAKNGDETAQTAQMVAEEMNGLGLPPLPIPPGNNLGNNSGNTRGGTVNTSQGFRLAPGDVILEINGEWIGRQEDVSSAIARSPQTMYLTVRDGRTGRTARYVTTLSASRPRFGMTHQTNPGGGSRVMGVNQNAPRIYLVE